MLCAQPTRMWPYVNSFLSVWLFLNGLGREVFNVRPHQTQNTPSLAYSQSDYKEITSLFPFFSTCANRGGLGT